LWGYESTAMRRQPAAKPYQIGDGVDTVIIDCLRSNIALGLVSDIVLALRALTAGIGKRHQSGAHGSSINYAFVLPR
jgi:hypothetical protein